MMTPIWFDAATLIRHFDATLLFFHFSAPCYAYDIVILFAFIFPIIMRRCSFAWCPRCHDTPRAFLIIIRCFHYALSCLFAIWCHFRCCRAMFIWYALLFFVWWCCLFIAATMPFAAPMPERRDIFFAATPCLPSSRWCRYCFDALPRYDDAPRCLWCFVTRSRYA